MQKWNVHNWDGIWWAFRASKETWFLTWQEAFDHAFTEATRELSDR